jgi:hypothetical protein
MAETNANDEEKLVGSLTSLPLNLFAALAELLISKGVITREEITRLVRNEAAGASSHGENERVMRVILETLAARFAEPPPTRESSH